jgi:hypothetical protein
MEAMEKEAGLKDKTLLREGIIVRPCQAYQACQDYALYHGSLLAGNL